ncbi:serine hydrolase domain-containing protein [Parafilimonas sp.]|uniref:serine hydrolase domain-containing protein n=1 Tax=Parafilimonas sp. TaxID=1969739 RepID=UPI0039E3DCB5
MYIKIFTVIVFACFSVALTAQQPAFKLNEQKTDSLLHKTYPSSLPGISIGIVQNGKTVYKKSYGISNINTGNQLTDSSNFNICSLTKQFTAIAILQLEQKHLLSLNDKLSRFFPAMNKKLADAITVKQLLTHTSGIPDHYSYTNTAGMQHAHNMDVYTAVKHADSTYFTPGTKFRYSNTAYCLLALIIEKLSGETYNDYMAEHVFKPAGMKHTVIWNETATIFNEVTAYERDSLNNLIRSGANEHIFFSTEGDGGIYASVNDYIQWFTALQGGKVFNRKIVDKARSLAFIIDKNKKTGYGFGWFIDEQDDHPKVYHSGDNGGFRTYCFSIPAFSYLIVIFANRNDVDVEKIVQQIVHLQFPTLKNFTPIEVLTS